jgi:hypothetical protein
MLIYQTTEGKTATQKTNALWPAVIYANIIIANFNWRACVFLMVPANLGLNLMYFGECS